MIDVKAELMRAFGEMLEACDRPGDSICKVSEVVQASGSTEFFVVLFMRGKTMDMVLDCSMKTLQLTKDNIVIQGMTAQKGSERIN